jgi:hypothetical protein
MNHSYYAEDGRHIPLLVKGYEIKDGKVSEAAYISMSVAYAAGALASTADDLLRWHRGLRAGKVLPKELLDRAWRPRMLPDGTYSGYGFGWKLCTLAGERTIEHGGFINGFNVNATQLPDADLDVIVLVNNGSDMPDAGALARRLARLLLTGSPEPKYVRLSAEQRGALTGSYSATGGGERKVFERDEVLYMERNGRPARALKALSSTKLTPDDGDEGLVYSFELRQDGRASRMRIASRCEPVDTSERISSVR